MMHSAGDIFIRIIADGLVVPIVLLAAFVLLRQPRRVLFERLARGVMVGLVGLWLAKIFSLLYQEGERPFTILGVTPKAAYLNNPGFPSDHVLFVFCITFVVWASTRDRKLTLIFLSLSTLVAIGRVMALVHTPLDVLGGFICALMAATIMYGRGFYRTKLLS